MKLLRIGIDEGHCLSGGDIGAAGYLVETIVNRQYAPLLIAGFQKLGHIVYDITPTQSGLTLDQSLAYRVNYANSLKLDLVISCHVNAFSTDVAQGCEVEYISASGKVYADKVCTEIAKLGFVNRGSQSRPNLYVLKYTAAVAILVEPFFCDSKTDCNKYDAKKIANAIIKGVTGQDVYVETPVAEPVVAPVVIKKIFDTSIPTGDNITPLAGEIGYTETIKEDGRVLHHLDRDTYISMINEGQESHIDIYTKQGHMRLM